MKKVCHIIFEHSLFDGRIFHKEATSLAQNGFNVIILAPTIKKGTIGRKKEIQVNSEYSLNNVTFKVYHYNKCIIKNFGIRNYFSKKSLIEQIKKIDADLYHFHEDNFTMEVAANFKKLFPKKKLVFDLHEFFLHRLRFNKKGRKRIRKYIFLENKIIKNADLLITVSDFMSDYYRTLTSKPVITILNCQSENIFQANKSENIKEDFFWIVHEGNMRFDRGLKEIIEIARLIKNPVIKFMLIGKLPKKEMLYFKLKTKEYKIEDKFFLTGLLPYEEVSYYLMKAKLGLNLIITANGKMGLGNKFYNYLRFGLPTISFSSPLLDKFLKEFEVGYSFLPYEISEIAEKIEEILNNKELYNRLSKNTKRAFKEKYNWGLMEKKLVEAYYNILGKN